MNQVIMNPETINQEIIIVKDLILENKFVELNSKFKELFDLIERKQGKYCNYKRSNEYYELEENIIKFIESSDDILFDTQTLGIICDNFKNIGSSVMKYCYRKICSSQMVNQSEIPDQSEMPDQSEIPDQSELLNQYKINNNLMLTKYILENYVFDPMYLVMFIHKIFAIVPDGTMNIGLVYCIKNFVQGIINNSSYTDHDKKIIFKFCYEVLELKNMVDLSTWVKNQC